MPTNPFKSVNGVSWIKRQSLAFILLWMVLGSVIVSTGILGSYGLNVIYENKLQDTWAIMFLELEQKGHNLSRKVQTFPYAKRNAAAAGFANAPDVLQYDTKGSFEPFRGNFGAPLNFDDLGLKSDNLSASWNVLQINGKDYLGRMLKSKDAQSMLDEKLPNSDFLFLWPIKIAKWLKYSDNAPDETIIYTFTREGKLLYANRSNITSANFTGRPLVQKFVSNPITQGQLEFSGINGEAKYGFFQEVPNTNIIMMAETSKDAALSPVRAIVKKSLISLLIVLIACGLLMQWPLKYTVGPLSELLQNAIKISKGNFDIEVKNGGFGEINALSNAFVKMGRGLKARDKSIKSLMKEQVEKVRLEKELAIASSVQANLLPQEGLPAQSGIELSAIYIPADECAGDWYQHYYDEQSDETIIAISDVSGHGAGSSMFTAIIASIFEQKKQQQGSFDLLGFANAVSNSIYTVGKRAWHSTSIVVKHKHKDNELEIMFCGHPFPFVKYPEDSGLKSSFIPGKSGILGMDVDASPNIKTIPFPKGSHLLLYTDGLIEAENKKGRQFGRKRIKSIINELDASPKQIIADLQNEWDKYREGIRVEDDICIISLRAS